MQLQRPILTPDSRARSYDEEFFDDMHGIFPNDLAFAPTAGGVGKYIYDGENWNDIVEHSQDFYVPRGDHELTQQALHDIDRWGVPPGIPYIDFGVGGPASFTNYALPMMQKLRSRHYTGVDFCARALARIKALEPTLGQSDFIRTVQTDFFRPQGKIIAAESPALGVMNGLTLTNMYGTLHDHNVADSLILVLRHLAQLCAHGWLLLTIDTNRDAASLRKAYVTPLNSRLYLSVFDRMAHELPTEDFDPSAFVYDPEFRADLHLWAHLARATRAQNFKLGPYAIHVAQNQKIHLLNSYKFQQSFFEACCAKAGLAVVQTWHHTTGMMLYLLQDTYGREPARGN